MTVKEAINNILFEGTAEEAGQLAFDVNKLSAYLQQKKKEFKNPINLKNFKEQYKTFEIFKNRAFGMYNRKLQQGYQINNTNENFENTIEPILRNFYNSL